MFWKKKPKVEPVITPIGLLFVQSTELSDRYYQKLLEVVPTNELVQGKENHWYFYFAVAAGMTGIMELNENYEENYYALMERFGRWDTQGVEAAKDFNDFIRKNHKIIEGKSNLNEVISLWIYFNVKESIDFVPEETGIFAEAGDFIYENFYGWFSKNSYKD